MAVDFKKELNISRTSEYRCLPDSIIVKAPLNGRYELPDIEWLIQSILREGQHTPVSIRRDGDKAVLVLGYSRWRAVNEINRRKLTPKPIQLRCTYTQADEKEGFLMTISENRFRNSTTPLDDAYNIKLLMHKFGMTDDQVALFYFPSADEKVSREAKKFVKDRTALLQLSDSAKRALIAGKLSGPAAKAIAKLEEEQQEKLIEKAGDGPVKLPSKGKKSPDFKKEVNKVIDSGALDFQGKRYLVPDYVVDWLSTFFPSLAKAEKEKEKDEA